MDSSKPFGIVTELEPKPKAIVIHGTYSDKEWSALRDRWGSEEYLATRYGWSDKQRDEFRKIGQTLSSVSSTVPPKRHL